MTERIWLTLLLVALGAGWGLTQPLSKIAVSEGYRHIGIVFWQLALGAILLGSMTLARGKRLPLERRHLRLYLVLALLGTVLPNSASYEAARHLPAGWLSLVLASVPMVAFPIALALGIDRFSWARLIGLSAGLAGVACLALPQSTPGSLPAAALPWLAMALIAPSLYAVEGNVVAKWGTEGLDAVQTLFGASVIGALIAGPIAISTGTWIDPRPPWGAPDAAVLASACIHAVVYSCYVWLVGRAGAVFAAQVSYLVTGCGVLWAMLLLGERYGLTFWIAMALFFVGLFLVQPRRNAALDAAPAARHDARRSGDSPDKAGGGRGGA